MIKMIQNLTIAQLINDFFVVHKNELPGASGIYRNDQNDIIRISALAWLTENCGKVYQEVTKNENLNADLIDIFAQTFVRHFWSTQIGYENPVEFFVHLRGFLDENLPVWAQFYKEAIVKQGLYETSTGRVIVEDNGTLHFEGNTLSSNKSQTTGKNQTDVSNNSSTKTDGTNSTNSNSSNLSAEADTPQDQINLQIDEGSGSASGSYDFSYASKVNGGLDQNKTTGTNSQTSTTTGTNGTTGTNSTDQTGSSSNQDSHDQQTGNYNRQTMHQRQQALSELAKSVSELHNGIYQNMFHKAKQYGLFLLVY